MAMDHNKAILSHSSWSTCNSTLHLYNLLYDVFVLLCIILLALNHQCKSMRNFRVFVVDNYC
ncbi:hypothetical protein ERO13_D05G059150v2 [Gossypium hirsutum]|uniref:Uncharacterized protein n=3 Tax=Gossypium TaxID=3633 RepID=A0A5D2UQR7_GOSMU|nr:hypothetical protein ERO13_D05G059150v2 [Gossypium hirsutum]TYG67239.1 hypothetical protein ES288_D05G062200v1 [Gossypium darwinii]TYH69544.1 hypothetical protein ES332_D05G063700v1 [Gossypium tomentosum]TYI80017.1 hypothetical protein E1A91_D05G062100v1 [Gossypium mustelinum]